MSNKGKNKDKKREKSAFAKQMPVFIAFLIIGAVCGFFIGRFAGGLIKAEKDTGSVLFTLAILFAGMYLSVFLHVVIHEAGHLVCGLLSGYKFSSFRIGSFMWLKEGGKVRLKRLTIAGTGGQCLMSPPELVEGKIPYVLYNFGGALANALTGLPALGMYFIFAEVPYLSTILLIFSIIGFGYALINGIPMRLGTIDNDGYNALSLGKDKESLRSFWVQMQANSLTAKGVRVKDMPAEWFTLPSEKGMKNSISATMGVFACNRLLDEHRFEEADKLMEELLSADTAIVDLHKNLMLCDRIYCELIGECRAEQLEKLFTDELKKFMKAMHKYPGILRTEYVYALLFEKDSEKAKQKREMFDKVAKTYPYECDILAERELMEIAEAKLADLAE